MRTLLATTVAPLVEFSDPTLVVENTESTLTREEHSVSLYARAAGLPPGNAVTAWWAIFNHPEYCEGECGPADVPNPLVKTALLFADGAVVSADGTATFVAELAEGDIRNVDPAHRGVPGAATGLIDAQRADVHLVLRTHGMAYPEGDPLREEQLTTFGGGCNPSCANLKAAIHDSQDVDVSIRPVLDFNNQLLPIEGASSRLTRDDDAVTLTIDTHGLEPGAYTVWWVVFNHPEYCAGDCFPQDIANPKTEASVLYATGAVVDTSGKGHFTARLAETDPAAPPKTERGPGMLDADRAEIHYIIRSHGAASLDPQVLQEQLTTQNGGCNPQCKHMQAGRHEAPSRIVLGDSDGDGLFNETDITQVLQAGKYATGQPADRSQGDWNGDGVFDRFDLVDALSAGSYRRGLTFEKYIQGLDGEGNLIWEGSGMINGGRVDVKTVLPIEPELGFSQDMRLRSLTKFNFLINDPLSGAMVDIAMQGLVNMGNGEIDLYGIVVQSDLPSLPEGSRIGLSADFTGAVETVTGSLRLSNPRL
jgi:hypothetical protein